MADRDAVFLLRHGENIANITKQFSHRVVDLPLTDKGLLQAGQAAKYILTLLIDAIYASPLQRADDRADDHVAFADREALWRTK